jgi:hypothetical protein
MRARRRAGRPTAGLNAAAASIATARSTPWTTTSPSWPPWTTTSLSWPPWTTASLSKRLNDGKSVEKAERLKDLLFYFAEDEERQRRKELDEEVDEYAALVDEVVNDPNVSAAFWSFARDDQHLCEIVERLVDGGSDDDA